MIKVSIIVPAYNTEKHITKCLESLINQTYKKIEIILVNDGSTDNTLKIMEYYQKLDSRIKIINQKNSGGIIARRNGISKSSGDYILIEDSDDWLEKDLVEKCMHAIKKQNKPDIIKFGYIREPSKKECNLLNDRKVEQDVLTGNKVNRIIKRLIYNVDCNQIWNEMIKKELFDFNNDAYKTIVRKGEDLQINLQIYQKAKSIVLLKDNLYHYLNNPNGITNNITTDKTINNVKDGIYLNKLREKLAIEKLGDFDNNKLVNTLLESFSKRIIKIIANSKKPKKDLEYIQDNIADILAEYIGNFKPKDIRQNFFLKIITSNIIKKKYKKNAKYKFLCLIIIKTGLMK